ncbi:MAG: hypothetical protein H6R08_2341, partial [Proteobacteria bacterium]|nr:hypothetical protein [Pseudomonadota bacterium]
NPPHHQNTASSGNMNASTNAGHCFLSTDDPLLQQPKIPQPGALFGAALKVFKPGHIKFGNGIAVKSGMYNRTRA